MKNPIGVYPGGRRVTLAEFLADDGVFEPDIGCPRCGAKLQVIGRNSQHPGFPRWEHMPYEGDKCDHLRTAPYRVVDGNHRMPRAKWLPYSQSDD